MNLIFKKLSLFFLPILLVGMSSNALLSQSEKVQKVVIITKKKNADGEVVMEKIVKEGKNIDQSEIDDLIEKAKKEGKSIDVDIMEEDRAVTPDAKKRRVEVQIEKEQDATTEQMIIKVDGEEINIDNAVEEDGTMIIKTEDGEVIRIQNRDGEEVEVTVEGEGNHKVIKKEHRIVLNEGMIQQRLEELNLQLPELGEPVANYEHAVRSNNWVFLAGKGPKKMNGENITGKLGKDLTVEQGYEAAKVAGLNLLAALKNEIGTLDRVKRIVKVTGMVNATADFTQHSQVINGFSDLMVDVFGEKGRHARAAVGMNSLPGNIAVEIEMVVEIE